MQVSKLLSQDQILSESAVTEPKQEKENMSSLISELQNLANNIVDYDEKKLELELGNLP